MTRLLALFVLAIPSIASAQLEWDEDFRDASAVDWTIGFGGLVVALQIAQLETSEPRWDGAGYFDRLVHGWTLSSEEGRRRAGLASDILGMMAMAPSFTLSPAAAYSQEASIGGEVAAVSLRSLGVTAVAVALTKHVIRRSRPGAGRSANRSFLSGHTTFAFTGAALTCVNHRHLEIFGGAADPLACGLASGLAVVTGLLRLLAGRHHLSDVLTGAVVGILSGWLIPKLATYGFEG